MQEVNVVCSQFLLASVLIPVLVMQARCDKKALVWQCYCKYWWSNQFCLCIELHGWISTEQL